MNAYNIYATLLGTEKTALNRTENILPSCNLHPKGKRQEISIPLQSNCYEENQNIFKE